MRFLGLGAAGQHGRWQWSGRQGLSRLQLLTDVTAFDPAAFRAEARAMAAAGVTLSEWRSTAAQGRWQPFTAPPALDLVVVLAGRVVVTHPLGRWEAEAQDVLSLRQPERQRWQLAPGTHLKAITVPLPLLPVGVQMAGGRMQGVLPRTKLVQAFAALLSQGMSVAVDQDRLPVQLARSLLSLALAVVDEQAPDDRVDGAELRARIVEHIDRHLVEPSLGPRSIADAFGISLRWVHRCFNGPDGTVARFIRIRRVDAVAEYVRSETRYPRLGLLALQFGYSGRDQLGRVFRWRYGVSVAQYHALAAEGRAPEPVPEAGLIPSAEVA